MFTATGMLITATDVVHTATSVEHTIRTYLTVVGVCEGHWVRTILAEQRSSCDKVTNKTKLQMW